MAGTHRRESAEKENHGVTQPGPSGKNQEGGGVQGLPAHLLHQWCPPEPHRPEGPGESDQDRQHQPLHHDHCLQRELKKAVKLRSFGDCCNWLVGLLVDTQVSHVWGWEGNLKLGKAVYIVLEYSVFMTCCEKWGTPWTKETIKSIHEIKKIV